MKYLKFCSLVFQKEIKNSLRSFRCSEPMKKQLNVLQNSSYITSQAKTAKAEGLQHNTAKFQAADCPCRPAAEFVPFLASAFHKNIIGQLNI